MVPQRRRAFVGGMRWDGPDVGHEKSRAMRGFGMRGGEEPEKIAYQIDFK